MSSEAEWDYIIQSKSKLLDLRLKEVWRYKDLMLLFVRRDFVAEYKQTILGPIWYLMQPIFTAVTYFLILNKAGGLPTDGLPPMLFYLSGLTIWSYFAASLAKTSDTFLANANVFGKVYFPRLIVPCSIAISALVKLALQFTLIVFFIAYFHFMSTDFDFLISYEILFLPIPIILMAINALGLGLMISAVTRKYRDLKFALSFGVQLMMYASAVIISFDAIPIEYQQLLRWNPLANIVEMFRAVLFEPFHINWIWVGYSAIVGIIIFFLGVVVFKNAERDFIDTV